MSDIDILEELKLLAERDDYGYPLLSQDEEPEQDKELNYDFDNLNATVQALRVKGDLKLSPHLRDVSKKKLQMMEINELMKYKNSLHNLVHNDVIKGPDWVSISNKRQDREGFSLHQLYKQSNAKQLQNENEYNTTQKFNPEVMNVLDKQYENISIKDNFI